jgi:hypothetical protein
MRITVVNPENAGPRNRPRPLVQSGPNSPQEPRQALLPRFCALRRSASIALLTLLEDK